MLSVVEKRPIRAHNASVAQEMLQYKVPGVVQLSLPMEVYNALMELISGKNLFQYIESLKTSKNNELLKLIRKLGLAK